LQVPRQVDVDAPALRDADRQGVEGLDQAHRIGVGVDPEECASKPPGFGSPVMKTLAFLRRRSAASARSPAAA
jgi:hypothetical protein